MREKVPLTLFICLAICADRRTGISLEQGTSGFASNVLSLGYGSLREQRKVTRATLRKKKKQNWIPACAGMTLRSAQKRWVSLRSTHPTG
jgi:hypothetical protein